MSAPPALRSPDVAEAVRRFIAENQTAVPSAAGALSGGAAAPKPAPAAPKRLPYGARAAQAANPAGAPPPPARVRRRGGSLTQSPARRRAGKALLETIERKQSNLCVAADVPTCAGVLALADAIGALRDARVRVRAAAAALTRAGGAACARAAHLLPEDARGHAGRLHARLWHRCGRCAAAAQPARASAPALTSLAAVCRPQRWLRLL
jgi:hypothetical protein